MGRLAMSMVVVLLAVCALPARASDPDSKAYNLETINALEVRLQQAEPREQCYLYAELVHQMTEVSLRQYSVGEVDKASSLLRKVQEFAQKIHLTVSGKDKRLKNAELLLRHTAFRLNGLLHASSYDDRALVAQTLAQVNKADNAAMMQVFKQ
ncbi:MAG TPA: hypothetical protein VG844_00090 [Terracidiphilus sp.]|jgi:hypothetical protein|nr:hypothetical protein [Terracidiphilus sp.]